MKYLLLSLPLLAGSKTRAQESNYHFSHTVTTQASPEKIWKIWTDVSNWPQWDSGIKKVTLAGAFEKGAKGQLIPEKGPRSRFFISEVAFNKSYIFKTRIPFGWLTITRSLEQISGLTRFTHTVEFSGLFKIILGNKIGKRYRKMLPAVMEKIKSMAENS